jgi:hypothetical protein
MNTIVNFCPIFSSVIKARAFVRLPYYFLSGHCQ